MKKQNKLQFEVMDRTALRYVSGGGSSVAAITCQVTCSRTNPCPTGGVVECACGGRFCIAV